MKVIGRLRYVTFVAAVSACVVGPAAVARGIAATVEINQASVTPDRVEVKPGDDIMFINHRADPVELASSSGGPTLRLPGHSTLQWTFARTGQIRYRVAYSGLKSTVAIAVVDAPQVATVVLGEQPAQPAVPVAAMPGFAPVQPAPPAEAATPGFSGTLLTTTSGPLASPAVPSSSFSNPAAPALTSLDAGPLASPAVPYSTEATNLSLEAANAESQQPGIAYIPWGYGAGVYLAPYASDNGLVSQTGTANLVAGYNPNVVREETGGAIVAPTGVPAGGPLPASNPPSGQSLDPVQQDSLEASSSVAVVQLDTVPSPETLVVPAGTTVTFVDVGGGQSVSSSIPCFTSATLARGGAFRYTYPTVGRFPYVTRGGGQGVVVVVPSSGP